MRTAEKWQEELDGETSVESIRAIQADAILGTLEIVQRTWGKQKIIAALAELATDTLSPNRKITTMQRRDRRSARP